MTDIVERLRFFDWHVPLRGVLEEAADEIARLRALINSCPLCSELEESYHEI